MARTDLVPLESLLDRQIAVGTSLLAALESERGTLTGFDLAALEESTATKERLVGEFDALDAQRRTLMAGLGYGPARADMLELIRATEDPGYREDARQAGPLASRWRRLVALAERCRDANERNGLIVSMHRRRVTKTLNVLRTGHADELTYGRAGTAAAAYGARALGRV
ncbi:MAG: flagellar protein FlgN [Proteobacteria bacterium]|nr:flagellar protein FlgN [Pseudomonadota bacterium]